MPTINIPIFIFVSPCSILKTCGPFLGDKILIFLMLLVAANGSCVTYFMLCALPIKSIQRRWLSRVITLLRAASIINFKIETLTESAHLKVISPNARPPSDLFIPIPLDGKYIKPLHIIRELAEQSLKQKEHKSFNS
jgi:hypothetical protein